MAEVKETLPLLMDELTTPERVMLAQSTFHGGHKVIIKLFDAACTRATADIVRLDPENPQYDHLLSVRTQRARNINEFCALVLKSIDYHVNAVHAETIQDEEKAVDAVAKTFGIHKVPPKPKKEIPSTEGKQ